MENNLIQFPFNEKAKEKPERCLESGSKSAELEEMREAFDDARKDWPLEMSELPEQNRIVANKLARR